jgi:hypothetical protein
MAIWLVAATALAAAQPNAFASAGPTPAQVRAAVKRAEHSRQLWTTINICNTPANPSRIGIRGQMPALGFPARLSMTVQVDYWDAAAKVFRPVPGATGHAQVKLGTVLDGVEQGGHTFRFPAGTGLLSGTITFQWRRGGKVVGHISKPATGGHHGVNGGDPPHRSAASCVIR